MRADPDPDRLFAVALVEGTSEAIASWIATGPESVHRLHQELTGERRVSIPDGISQRDVLDNLMSAAFESARAFPDEFLTVFAASRWDESPAACSGFGAIRRPEVTERLMGILKSGNHWRRIDAAVALRGHHHPDLEAALEAALPDPDYLVRHHVEERLLEIDHLRRSPQSEH